ncbi:hypothetical protein [Flavobacterium sp.]|jgi:hypothetical protein|uniref:hypothetical protein n=1 Tax=Flavobacterium sp. TaxID=239 RepID=UPI0037C05012
MFKEKNTVNKITGNKVEVFGQELYLRNLTLGGMRRLEPLLDRLNGSIDNSSIANVIGTISDVIQILTERDYEFNREDFEENVDVEEVHAALPLMLEAAGLAQKKTT